MQSRLHAAPVGLVTTLKGTGITPQAYSWAVFVAPHKAVGWVGAPSPDPPSPLVGRGATGAG
ncbi:hypothetical protein GCM10025789_25580 [Tessaracoccus lubricantis]|uniref:Uncharacterized protein n=1 Tax=Tessaracoccus lubricantis TaxID=545543 RepID=A0ABP9FTV6_9ACTN